MKPTEAAEAVVCRHLAKRFTSELTRDAKHIVLVEPAMKQRIDEATEWYKKHFPHNEQGEPDAS